MSTTLQQIPTGTYELDPVHSSFGFTVKHNGISTFRGQFERVQAKLENGVLSGIAHVDSVKTPIPQLKDHLLSAEFFNAAETPTIEFRSLEIEAAADGTVELEGELTIRGVTHPVTARGTFGAAVGLSGDEVVGFELQASVDRRGYGLNWQAPLPSGGDAVAWEVALEVHLELVKA